jgi:Fibronectin type III domain/Beta-propeller repeat
MAFEQNQGQTDGRVKYLARTNGYTLFLTANEAVFSLYSNSESRHAVINGRTAPQSGSNAQSAGINHNSSNKTSAAVMRMQFAAANSETKVSATDEVHGKSNYFIGNDPRKWRNDIPLFGRINYANVYPGVDVAFHGEQRQLEFDFVVAPGADPKPIAFHFAGAQRIKTDNSGNLHLFSSVGDIMLYKPIAYQLSKGARQAVDARFVLNANKIVSFELGNYDHARELVIDPAVAVLYSTYLGGSDADEAEAIAINSSTGNAYVTGQTASPDFPGNSSTNKFTETADVFVTEMNSAGTSFLYSTYVGGSGADASGTASGYGIALDKSGDVFVVGGTNSTDFPHTSGAFQSSLGSGATSNAFIFALNASGALTYATYFGGSGSDVALGMAFDQSTGVYAVVGSASSADFPLKNPLQSTLAGTSNGFVSLWNSSGNTLTFSTYLGAASGDSVNAVALDSSDNVYVTGKTSGPRFPATSGAFQTICDTGASCNGGLTDAFVTEINSSGSKFVFSTFLGGSNNDLGDGIAVDPTGIYVTGQTESNDFPVVPGGFQSTFGSGTSDAFVTKLNSSGSKELYSSYLGVSAAQIGASIVVDSGGNAYVTGQTDSLDFPTANPTQATLGGGEDAFVTEVNPSGSKLLFSTYLGGSQDEDDGGNYGAIAVDTNGGNIYVAGNTASSTDFPVSPNPGALQTAYGGGSSDAFVAKYAQQSFGITATTPSPSPVSPGSSATSTVTLTALNGYASPVHLSCTVTGSGSPLPTCSASSFSSNPVTPSSGGVTTKLTISVPTSSGAVLPPWPKFDYAKFNHALWLPLAGLSLAGLVWSFSDLRPRYQIGLMAITIAGIVLLPACGNNGSVTGAICAAAPSAPTGLAASSTTSTSTTLNWTASTVVANCSVTGYTIYENGKSIGTSTTTTFNVTGLTPATMYSFTVAASDSAGFSAQSSAVPVTTAGTYTITITGVGTDANATTESVSTTLTVN